MPRPPSIWLRKQTGWYCVTLNGETVKLSKSKAEAQLAFHRLMAARGDAPAPPAGVTFRRLADGFLADTRELKSAETFAVQVSYLKAFAAFTPAAPAAGLKGHVVTAWLAHEAAWRAKAGRKAWNVSTRAMAVKTLKAALNWGVRQGHLAANPLKGLTTGSVRRRDRVITPDENARIMAFLRGRDPDFADYLFVVSETGARPYTEVGRLEARHVDLAAGTATLKEHKTARKTGRDRVIFFPPASLAVLAARVARYPAGRLFRTKRGGGGWNRSNTAKWFTLIRDELGIEAFAYAYRHTRITHAIIQGVPVEVVAALVGNTSAIIHKHYAHVGKDQAALRAAAAKAVS